MNKERWIKVQRLLKTEPIELSDSDLLEAYDIIRANLSYFLAAEGLYAWNKERNERDVCKKKYEKIKSVVNDRKLKPNKGTYLV